MSDQLLTIPFIYRWDEISTGKWYIGAHYRKGCHPNDGYICSSKVVKPLIKNHPNNWIWTIIEICPSVQIAKDREAQILQELNARIDPNSYNKTNADGKFGRSGSHSEQTKQLMKDNRSDFSGANNPMYGKIGGMAGKTHSAITKQKIRQSLIGQVFSTDHKVKISNSLQGLHWINDGEISASHRNLCITRWMGIWYATISYCF
jgi:hypothetical protein